MDTTVDMGEDYLFVVDYCEKSEKDCKALSSSLYIYELSNNGLQVSANKNNNLKRRLSQLDKLENLFKRRNYPMNAIYKEKLRIIYTSLLESNDLHDDLIEVLENGYLDDLIHSDINLGKKYTVFLEILRSRHIDVAYLSMNIFRAVKKIQGKSFNWG